VLGEHIATVVGLLDHLRLAKATIVGHSMGGSSRFSWPVTIRDGFRPCC
jgi:pimeloyl-ACP methyl ester carboxylesterase